jgi:galactokinase
MTGGGFGGCVLALVDAAATGPVGDAVRDAFAAAGFAAPEPFVAVAGPGAARLRPPHPTALQALPPC